MIGRKEAWGYECVVVDLNTQQDFCDVRGAYPVVNSEVLIPALRRVVAWAKWNHVPVISSLDSHRRWEMPPDGQPPHCLEGSVGQRKLPFTVFPLRTCIGVDNTMAVPFNLFKRYQQVIFPEHSDDLLANPKADRLLTQMRAREFILFGNGVEGAVKALALGLLARGKQVTVVLEACGYWSRPMAELTFRQLSAKGARLVHLDAILARRLSRRYRYSPKIGKRIRSIWNGLATPTETEPALDRANGNGRHGQPLSKVRRPDRIHTGDQGGGDPTDD